MTYLIDLTLDSPGENLALDEALVDACDLAGRGTSVLRFWESPVYFAVLGYAKKVHEELNLDLCQGQNVPVLRRCSGGGTVLQGPGCLNYALIMDVRQNGTELTITQTNDLVMQAHQKALKSVLGNDVEVKGCTDLAVGDLKFSGNSQRRKKNYFLFHGTFLIDFDMERIERFLQLPQQQPVYRSNRLHRDFLTNLHVSREKIKEVLIRCWKADGPLPDIPYALTRELFHNKYSKNEWNFKY